MRPFGNLVNTDGLSNHYTDIFYTYDDRVGCSAANINCQSRFLFCDLSHGWPACASKIVLGGNCAGFFRGEDCCYNGRCVNNVCVSTANIIGTRPRPIPRPITRPRTIPGTRTRPFFLATSPVRSSIMRKSKANVECFNENECCEIWKEYGYCTSNPTYMMASCKASCGSCAPNYNISAECSDRSSTCPTTASECQSRQDWMKENCRRSCSFCDQTRQQACTVTRSTGIPPRTTTPLPPRPRSSSSNLQVRACTDYHFCCAVWSTQNLCTDRSTVQRNCQMSCNVCQDTSRSTSSTECLDYHSLCEAWADANLCDTRQDYMWENCRWSCRKCDLLRPRGRLAACQSIRPPSSRTALRKPTTQEDQYVIPKELPTQTMVAPSSGY